MNSGIEKTVDEPNEVAPGSVGVAANRLAAIAGGAYTSLRVNRTRATVAALYMLVVALLIGARFIKPSYGSLDFTWTTIALASFTAVCAFGQGIVVLSGGIDLSIPGVITFTSALLTQWAQGSDSRAAWVVPAILAIGFGIGCVNGIGVTLFRINPVVMTLAANVILGGVILVITSGTLAPAGGAAAPPAVAHAMQNRVLGGIPLVDFLLLGFVAITVLLLHKSAFGRKVYAIGTNPTAAYLSGLNVRRTTTVVYGISGFCSALTGIMLTGFVNESFLGMGDPYLLLSIAAVVVGGAAITGGRGYYLGTVAAAILLSAVTTILIGTTLPEAVRQMVYAGAILAAVVASRGGSEPSS